MHRDERNFSILFDDAHFLETEVLVCNAGQHAIRSLDDDGNPIAQEDDPIQHRVRRLSRRLAASSASSGSSSQSGDASGDEETLTRIAERTGGRYFNARDADALVQTYAAIDDLERSEVTEVRYLQYREHYGSLVVAALVLIAVSVFASGTLLRRLP